MKLKFDIEGKIQPDPFIFFDDGRYYLYVTAAEGVEAYSADSVTGLWHYLGTVTETENAQDFWAPSVIKIDATYYMYVSFLRDGNFQFMHVLSSSSPEGPFKNEKCLYERFSIDSHMVKTEKGLFLWYAEDNLNTDKVGTRVFIDRFIDPETPEHNPKEVILPSFPEEKFTPQCTKERDWYTVEGPFWFKKDGWQYVMYSAGCYKNDTYHIGYASAHSDEEDLKTVDFVKHTDNGRFAPVVIKNEFEEGTGHHSVISCNGEFYAIYHGRDYTNDPAAPEERRTARICRLIVDNGTIKAERFPDRL